MAQKTIEELQAENEMLKKVLNDQVDYHHFIGNRECTISVNESFIHLYNSAKNALIETKSWSYGI